MPPKRTRPLSAQDLDAPDEPGVTRADTPVQLGAAAERDLEVSHDTQALVDPEAEQLRHRRFAEGLRALRVGGGTLNLNERLLMVIGGVVAPLGVIVLLLGWWGASRTPYLFEQVPYLISGGLFGLALVFLGAFFYFTHWLTQLVKEHRAQSAAMVEAIGRLQEEFARHAGGAGFDVAASGSPNGASPATAGELQLVATPQGNMAHRVDCVVVAGKHGLRRVSADDGLAACKLCDPYGTDDA